jgi:hypothetical protein
MDVSKTITRRAAFLGAGALSIGTVVPVVAAARHDTTMPTDDTPVMVLFRRWQRAYTKMQADVGEQFYDTLNDACAALEMQIVATPAVDAQDILAKLVAYMNYGAFPLESREAIGWGVAILDDAKAFFDTRAVA